MKHNNETVICVVGLGYVGLPLALAFGRTHIKTYGFDISKTRVNELKRGFDITKELDSAEIQASKVEYSSHDSVIKKSNFIVIAVPTPIDKANVPDLTILKNASQLVGQNLQKNSIVVYESTVFPGATEDVCAPILEKNSGLECGKDFKVGYSPERINPGDKEHTLERIVKVVSGMDTSSTDIIAATYGVVCLAGVHITPNIKTAEAAKVIENTQRDINIALMNELSLIFNRIGINTYDVLAAAGTKWNFLKFTPGLVGGHCIGVDPYYLVHKAEEMGYHPQVIASGRRINDSMAVFVAEEVIKGLIQSRKLIQRSKVLVMGLSFKENVTDIRNTKISDTINQLGKYGVQVTGYDPIINIKESKKEFNCKLISRLAGKYDAIIIAQNHAQFKTLDLSDFLNLSANKKKKLFVFDIKNTFPFLKRSQEIIYNSL